jgi:purine-binding chemotaxis protein CheW
LDGRLAGLIVDGASEVIRVTDEMIEPAPEMLAEIGAGYVAGVVNLSGRFVTLVDLKKALTDEITCELDEVLGLLASDRGLTLETVQVVKG